MRFVTEKRRKLFALSVAMIATLSCSVGSYSAASATVPSEPVNLSGSSTATQQENLAEADLPQDEGVC